MACRVGRMPSTVLFAGLLATTACGGSDSANPFGGQGSSAAGGATGDTGGAAGSAAAPTTGGRGTTGGTAGRGGTTATTVDGGGHDCGFGAKWCNGICVPHDPFVGCGETSCAPCPDAPANAVPACLSSQCGYECLPGYRREGLACVGVPLGDGGAADASPPPSDTTDGGSGGNPLVDCPAAEPVTGDICLTLALQCQYGSTTCSCLAIAMLPFWYCQQP